MKRVVTVLLVVLLVGCGDSAGTTQGFCRRFVKLAESDTSLEDFVDDLQEAEIGRPGGTIGESHRRLLGYLKASDPRAESEVSYLYDTCVSAYG